MMGGAGFIKHMIAVTKENRRLLKSEGNPYTNFDKSYITDYIINKKRKVSEKLFKKASPAYYHQLRERIREENRIVRLKKMLLFMVIVLTVGLGSWYYLFA